MFLDEPANKLPDFTSGSGIQFFTDLNKLLALGGADTNQQLTIFFVELGFTGFIRHKTHSKNFTQPKRVYALHMRFCLLATAYHVVTPWLRCSCCNSCNRFGPLVARYRAILVCPIASRLAVRGR